MSDISEIWVIDEGNAPALVGVTSVVEPMIDADCGTGERLAQGIAMGDYAHARAATNDCSAVSRICCQSACRGLIPNSVMSSRTNASSEIRPVGRCIRDRWASPIVARTCR